MKKTILLSILFIKSLLAMEEVLLIDNEINKITDKSSLEQSIMNGDAYEVYRLLILNNYNQKTLKEAANIAEEHGYYHLAQKLRKHKKSSWNNVYKIHKKCQKDRAHNDIIFAIEHGDIKTIDYLLSLYPELWHNSDSWHEIAFNSNYETLAKALLGKGHWKEQKDKGLMRIINDINYTKIAKLYGDIDENNNLNEIIMLINFHTLKKLRKEDFYGNLLEKLKNKLIYLFISDNKIINNEEIWDYVNKKHLCIGINNLIIDTQNITHKNIADKDIKEIFKNLNKKKFLDVMDLIEKKPHLIEKRYEEKSLADIALEQNNTVLNIALTDYKLWFALDKYKMFTIILSNIASNNLYEVGI